MSLDMNFYLVNKSRGYDEEVRRSMNESVFWSKDYDTLYDIMEQHGEKVEEYGGCETYKIKGGIDTFVKILKEEFVRETIDVNEYARILTEILFIKKILFLEVEIYMIAIS